jgi:hypothetical protein
MKLLGGKHAGIWLMGKNHKHYWNERLLNLSLLHIHRTRNISVEDVINKFAVRSLGLEPDMFTLQANSPTTVLLMVNDKPVNVSIHF